MPQLSSFLAFKPSFFQSMKGYSKEKLIKDITAGLTVGVVALPLAMAFAIASGLTPQTGIFTAIIAGFLISMLGGSKVQIGGPAGAFIVIVYGIVERYGLSNLIIAVAMSGVLLFLMGRFQLGTLIRFIPVSVVIGFTNGIAVLIGLSQMKDFLGLEIPKMPADFFGVLHALWLNLHTINYYAIAVAVATLVIIVVWQHFTPGLMKNKLAFRGKLTIIPGSIVALVITSIVVKIMGLPVETIGSRFGGIPAELPRFIIPELNWESARHLLMPAITLALLGAIESLLCARVADSMTGDRHDPNQELMAQGVANVVTSLFGGMPATGTIARTVTNIKSGASTPVAGMVHALSLLLIVLVAAPLAAAVPLPTLAAVLVFVAWNMGEWREFVRLRNYTLPYRVKLLAVFFLTVVFDLTVAVEVGLVTSLLAFIYSMSSLSRSEKMLPAGTAPTESDKTAIPLEQTWNDADMRVWRLHGTLFFGAVRVVEQIADNLPARVLVIDFKNLMYMDASGAEEIVQLAEQCHKHKISVILSGLAQQPQDKAQRVGVIHLPGVQTVETLDQAIAAAKQICETAPVAGA
ncbi:MAG: STAS domain-containing protein [Brachymonas sp.]|jgi:SulP family sulfate permease|nr:STAS domain-containing protein [Brachymonas sp.]MBP9651440.1 STAS domain-containing protein [Brachymonas sp.]